MKRISRMITSGLLLTVVCSTLTSVSAAEELTICARSDGPPKHFVDSSGKVSGYAAEIASLIAEKAGFHVTLKAYPWKRAQDEARKGNCVITGFSRTLQREAEFVFTRSMYIDRVLLWYRADNPVTYDSYEDLFGKPIGIAKGSRYSGEFELNRARLSLVEALNSARLLQLLQGGRIDLAIISGDRASVNYIARRDDIDISRFQAAERPVALDSNHIGVPFSLRAVAAGEALERLDAAIDVLTQEGALEAILKRYRSTSLQ